MLQAIPSTLITTCGVKDMHSPEQAAPHQTLKVPNTEKPSQVLSTPRCFNCSLHISVMFQKLLWHGVCMSAVFGVLLLVFFATLFRSLGLGCVCIGMSGSRILLPSYFTRGLPRVLCNPDKQASHLRSVTMCFDGEENATSNFQRHCTSRKHVHDCNTVPGRVLLVYIYQDTAPMPRRAAPGTTTCISKDMLSLTSRSVSVL